MINNIKYLYSVILLFVTRSIYGFDATVIFNNTNKLSFFTSIAVS